MAEKKVVHLNPGPVTVQQLQRFTDFSNDLVELATKYGYDNYLVSVRDPDNPGLYRSAIMADTIRSAHEMNNRNRKLADDFVRNMVNPEGKVILEETAKNGAAEKDQLAVAEAICSVVATYNNMSVDQVLAVLKSLSTIDIKGETAGLTLKSMLLAMNDSANETNPRRVGLEAALENLNSKKLTTARLTEMFGPENVVAATHLINRRELFTKNDDH